MLTWQQLALRSFAFMPGVLASFERAGVRNQNQVSATAWQKMGSTAR